MKNQDDSGQTVPRFVPILVCHLVLVIPLLIWAMPSVVAGSYDGDSSVFMRITVSIMMFLFLNVAAGICSGGFALAQMIFPRISRRHAVRICLLAILAGYAAAGVILQAESAFLHFVPSRSPWRILMRMADIPIAAIVCAALLLLAFKFKLIGQVVEKQELPTKA